MARKPTGGTVPPNPAANTTGGTAVSKRPRSSDRGGANRSREDEVLMREIDDAVRQDDATRFFQKYGISLGVALAFLLAAMLAYWWWESSREGVLEAQSETLIGALDSLDAGDVGAASDQVAPLIDDGTPGARSAARFIQAAAALEDGDTARAVDHYAAIVADPDTPDPLRDLALVRQVSANFDRMKPAEVIAKLAPLATPDNPFFGSAGELVAIAHLEAGNRDKAGALFARNREGRGAAADAAIAGAADGRPAGRGRDRRCRRAAGGTAGRTG